MLNIEIDGKQVSVPSGSTIMDAANQVGVYIPHFCYHKKLTIAANCRMCLVQVEKAAKPLPACATPATDGMKVFTKSDSALKAQKGVMEFLLINHPLDCPICDQGGECQLQDLAVGYGASKSRYEEEKRVVSNKNLGPLVATDMTRCIHCTRCVRFGQEIAGIMEMGQVGRGEHSEIMPFVESTINSELSGNIIDLCPVGALTSKPFRYTARTWELSRRKSVSPHDGLGSNLIVHVKQNRVMRVLPAENEEINECWISDKDRFSYEGLNSEDRLTVPMIKRGGEWRECEWQEALEYVANGLTRIKQDFGADQIGALAIPHSTLEELYLLQKLMRGLGSGNVDHRLLQSDFSADGQLQGAPWLGQSIASLEELDRVLVIGSTLRKDHPLIALRLRKAVKHGAELNIVNPVDEDLLTQVANKAIVSPVAMVNMLAQILKALAEIKSIDIPSALKQQVDSVTVSDSAQAIASSLAQGERRAVLLGNLAQHHPRYAELSGIAQTIAEMAGAQFGVLGEAANSVGAYVAGAVPMYGSMGETAKTGLNAAAMLEKPLNAYILLGAEMELDSYNPQQAIQAMQSADLVVAMSAYKHGAMDYADVMLPIAPFSETSGTFINTAGRVQSFHGVVKPLGETRPAWKILRVLANLLNLKEFEYDSTEMVRAEMLGKGDEAIQARLNNLQQNISVQSVDVPPVSNLQRVGEIPVYQADPVVRRAESLQRTQDAAAPEAFMHGDLLQKLQISEGGMAMVRQKSGQATLRAMRDDQLPGDCVRIAGAHALTASLGELLGEIEVEKA
ncbi:NADH-quinone oxidoreductase subunit NuoG [Sulfurirhabdus autotrophica]|uniref:NADH-quinone oxidoreductase n=1 Tax=Sulfurirhabdus autotrophica TaxID=1706046 RepID=A0A4R3YF51_9PROT|nr:NADH-quinone oxidoreductase subunit NuoG [Sulfurirhabdus autotrophica]TCV90817.1 NADH dehydrogenase subunit G [Sulfurirhabdus autotrophica]